ncbi:MAG TPA: hypothetical protein VFV70_11660, partial [Hyphomonadaceae bacterium]|nr:hypothetical protein [Hyphomonadaceae bacterium]
MTDVVLPAQVIQPKKRKPRQAVGEGPLTRAGLLWAALVFLLVILVAPLVIVFFEAFSRGLAIYFSALSMPDTLSALQLTLLVAAIAVP